MVQLVGDPQDKHDSVDSGISMKVETLGADLFNKSVQIRR